MSSDSEKPATDAKPEDKPKVAEEKPKATVTKPEDKSKVAEEKPKATDVKPEEKPLVEDKPKATVAKPEDKPIVADKPKATAPPAKKPEDKPVELPAFEKGISDKIVEKFGDKIKVAFVKKDRVRINVSRENVHDVAEFIRDGLNYDHVESVTGVDFPAEKEIEVVYHIGSYTDSSLARQILVLATRAQREENPIPGSDSTRLPTLRDIFYSVEFHEREIFEMLGVYFDGHPDNRRLLLPEDWADLPPLRKDFAIKGR